MSINEVKIDVNVNTANNDKPTILSRIKSAKHFQSRLFLIQVAQIVIDILVIICASSNYGFALGGGVFVNFVASASAVLIVIQIILYLTTLNEKINQGRLTIAELGGNVVFLALYFIAIIIAGTNSNTYYNGASPGGIIATTVFCCAAAAIRGFLTVRMGMAYRTAN